MQLSGIYNTQGDGQSSSGTERHHLHPSTLTRLWRTELEFILCITLQYRQVNVGGIANFSEKWQQGQNEYSDCTVT